MGRGGADNLWQASSAERVEAPALEGEKRADLAIIGGGYSGLSAALQAAQSGARVVLLEGKRIGHGGSGRNVGLVNAGLWMAPEQIVARLGAQAGGRLNTVLAGAPDAVFALIARHEIACEPVRAGTLHCAHAPRGRADLAERHRQLRAIGAPVELLDAQAARARVGSAAVHGALFDPRAGTIQPLAYARGLARAAQGAGARICENSPVIGVAPDGAGWKLTTPGGRVFAGALLQATNGYLGHDLNFARQDFVPVDFFQIATAPLPADLRARILPGGEGCWDTAQVMSSFRLDRAGRLIVGGIGNLELPGGAVHRAWARRKLAQLFPEAAGAQVEHAWHGRIAMTGDHLPKIVAPGQNALACFGYSGRGIGPGTLLGAACAKALLDGDESALPLAPIAAHGERFSLAKQAFYESGATLTHLVGARGGAGRPGRWAER